MLHLQFEIQQALEKWIEAGRHREAIREDEMFILRYSSRFRSSHLMNLAVFAAALTLGIAAIRFGFVVEWKMILLFSCIFSLAALLCAIYVVYVFTSRVTIERDRVQVYCFWRMHAMCTRENVSRAYRSSSHPSLVIVDKAGKKTRISTQFDGMRALVAWFAFLPDETLDEGIRKWMHDEDNN
jgi:hypothetical protein